MPIIKKVITKKPGHRPILIDFDNAKVKPECVKTLEAQLYETKLNEKLVTVTSDKLLYCGEIEDDDLYQNFVIVHKKSSDQVKLFQVDHVMVRAKFSKKREFEISPAKDNAADELNKQFGSKKAKRVTEQRERLTMNINAVKQQLEQTVATMSMMTHNIDYNNQALSWRILPLKKSLDTKNTEIATGETLTIQFTDPGHLSDIGNANYQILQNEPKYPTQCNMQVLQESYIQEPPKPLTRILEEVKIAQNKEVKPKKKINRLPIDGTLYHSQQLGLKVPPKKTLGTRGRIIESQAREVIHNVFKFMRDEAQNGIKIPISNYRERVLRATGISKCTYYKITTREFKRGGPQPTKRKRHVQLNVASLQGVGVKVDHIEQVSENDSIYRPKINRDASTPDSVYNLEDLVEAYILDTLAVEASKIIEAGSADEFGLCKFATTNINKLLTSNFSEEEKIRSLTIFLYLHYLIKFMQTPMKNIKKKFVVCDKSIDVNNHILKIFSEMGTSGRTRPLHMKDKALCYTMILAAIAMEFEVDVELLSKDLKIGMKKVVEVARILAFNMKANNKNVVQLKLPLPAPVTYTPKRGRR